ncbi:hypothetical protein FA15DRAFT_673256 [Coprinopsis marcescibilis]|uniref:Uncharacterized protein n=1 Tax=Coprinopsis marcescibilis TaxID=230819 RepID=A0A5C3KK68_COPMA|nr:hypothetical protein FA15DRAFT_673256 [Coprinopsis marcescibilis]
MEPNPELLPAPFNATLCTPEIVEALGSTRITWIQAGATNCVGYGIVLTLATICMHSIFRDISHTSMERLVPSKRKLVLCLKVPIILTPRDIIAFLFVVIMTAFSTMSMVSINKSIVTTSAELGCWNGLTVDNWYGGVNRLGYYSYVLTTWVTDGIMVWRCWVIYRSCSRLPIHVTLLVPTLLYLSVIGMGMFFAVPGTQTKTHTRNYEVLYSCLTLSLNVTITVMIVVRLLVYRRRIAVLIDDNGERDVLGYTSYVAILTESASLIVVSNIFLIVSMKTQSYFQSIAFTANSQLQIIAPFLIVARVLKRKAWSPDTDKIFTSTGSFRARPQRGTPLPGNRERHRSMSIIQFSTPPPTPLHRLDRLPTNSGPESETLRVSANTFQRDSNDKPRSIPSIQFASPPASPGFEVRLEEGQDPHSKSTWL